MADFITLVQITAFDPTRWNDLGYSRDLSNAAWTKTNTTVSANAATSWDNSVSGDLITETTAAASFFGVSQFGPTSFGIGASVWASIMVKPNGRTRLRIQTDSTGGTGTGDFDLAAGTVGALTGIAAASQIATYAGGWFRCSVRFVPTVAGFVGLKALLNSASGYGVAYTGDGVSGMYFDQGQVVQETALGDFVETTGAAGFGTRALRYGTHGFVTSGADFPAHVAFTPRIITPPVLSRQAFSNARVTGGASVSGGAVELVNTDQALAALLDLGLDGRDITVQVGYAGTAYPSAFTTVWTGTIEQPEIGTTRAILRLRDRLAFLALPLQPTKYLGTNVLPAGAEGVADDIKGQPKPDVWGRAFHIPLVMVNTALLILQAHSGQIQGVDAVYDSGVALSFGTDRANLAAMVATAPAAGFYDTCLALGLIRVNARSGRLTATVQGDAAGSYVSRVGAIVSRILTTRCGIASAQLNAASFTALDAAANYEVGLWVGAETTPLDAINRLLASVGGWLAPSRAGLWTITQLVAPSGTAAATFTDATIIDIQSQATRDPDKGVPVGRVDLQYRPYFANYSVSDLAPGLAEASKTEFTQPWRKVSASDAATQAVHLLAPTMAVDTLLTSGTDAATERDRRLALHKARRDYVRVRVPLTTATAALDLGSIVDVTTAKLGYASTRKFVVVGVAADRLVIDFDLWG